MMNMEITGMILIIFMLIAAVYDIRTMHVPLWVICINLFIGTISVYIELNLKGCPLADYTLSAVVIFLVILFILIFKLFRVEEVGLADGLLIVSTGMILKGERLIMAIGLAMILAGLFAGVLLVIRKAGRKSRIPFVPFLTVGIVISILFLSGGMT